MFSAVGEGEEFEGTPLYVYAVLSLLEAWCSVSAACDEAWMLPGRQVGRCGRYCGRLLCLCDSRRRLRRRHGGGGHLVIYIAALRCVAWRALVSPAAATARLTMYSTLSVCVLPDIVGRMCAMWREEGGKRSRWPSVRAVE